MMSGTFDSSFVEQFMDLMDTSDCPVCAAEGSLVDSPSGVIKEITTINNRRAGSANATFAFSALQFRP